MPGTAIFYSRLNGTAPLTLTLYNVVDDSWYEYEVAPPAPRIKLQLHPGVADEAGAARPALAVAVSPRLARTSVMVRAEVAEAGVRGAARVYDAAGVPVREFALSTSKGILSARWDLTDAAGNRVSPGIYYCQVSAGSARGVAKVIVTQ
jgi:hypothetical protein